MRRLILIAFFPLLATLTYAQGVSKEWADSFLTSLKPVTPAADRMHAYFMAAQYYIFKAGEEPVDLDRARDYMRKAATLNKTVGSSDATAFQVLLQSLLAREERQLKEGRTLAEQAVRMLQTAKNKYYLGVAYFSLSEYYDYQKKEEGAEKKRLMALAAESFRQSGNIEQQAYSLKFLADLYALDDQRSKALQYLNLSLQIYKSMNYPALQGVYVLFSNIYFTDGNYKQALNYGLLALQAAQKIGDTSMSLCQINNYIAKTYVRLKEPETALSYYKTALAIAEKNKENDGVLELLADIARTYIEMKKPARALDLIRTVPKPLLQPQRDEAYIYLPLSYLLVFSEQGNDAATAQYCEHILQLIKSHNPSDKDLHDFYLLLISYYLHSRQFDLAGNYIRLIDSLSRKIGDPHLIKENSYLKFRLDTTRENYRSAVGNLLEYQALNDSLFTETSNRQIKQLEMEFESEKNKSELKLRDQNITMLSQQNQLQASRLKAANLTRNITIGGIISLAFIVLLLYWQYRHKQRTNQVITQKNEQLEHLLSEKEWLVKEIHHRVKNNFHVVANLLEIQSSYLKNPEALYAVKESQHRIHSMSIIHQKLYQSEGLSTVHMPEYIYELVEYLKASYGTQTNIGFELQIENIELNHSFAVTLGLILNEAITNSIKYAFPQTEQGKIYISLKHVSATHILLTIADNGRGLPAGFDTRADASMGMELLQGLTEDMGGWLTIQNNNGTQINISFRHDT